MATFFWPHPDQELQVHPFGQIVGLVTSSAAHKNTTAAPAPVKKSAKARQSSVQLQLKRHLKTGWLFGLPCLRMLKAAQV
ncbi:MAG: hypothetical protein JWR54_2849 [Mucilaginibacter sp.]|nr:hypothetical protein [Mucilaginibacter sp.]